jgi:hypothetical protein
MGILTHRIYLRQGKYNVSQILRNIVIIARQIYHKDFAGKETKSKGFSEVGVCPEFGPEKKENLMSP